MSCGPPTCLAERVWTARLAGPGDLPEVFALRHEVFVLGQGVPEEIELDELDEVCDHALVRADDGAVVATGRLVPSPAGWSGTGSIGRMAVAERVRGQGAGATVLAFLEGRARERGLESVELHAQVQARGFYERVGYAAYGDVYDEAGIPHLSMLKQLTGP